VKKERENGGKWEINKKKNWQVKLYKVGKLKAKKTVLGADIPANEDGR
jgi:hypothetical protein